MERTQENNKFIEELLGKKLDPTICPLCDNPPGPFRDKLSEKEWGISGMCQKCQDKIFGKE